MIRVVLPAHLRTLARVDREVKVAVHGPATPAAVLDALEAAYPMLRGTIRDQVTHQRRAFLRFFATVEQEVGVVGELLDAGVAVLMGVEARLQETQGERRAVQHLAAPAYGLVLERGERHDRVDEPHLQRLLG